MKRKVHPQCSENGDHSGWLIECPACGYGHFFEMGPRRNANGDVVGSGWTFNGDFERPTFTPSMLCRTPAHTTGAGETLKHHPASVCHSIVTDGLVTFLADCTHSLAGQTVYLEEF